MAFKASTKRATKAPLKSSDVLPAAVVDIPVIESVPTASLSIDDFVGGPVVSTPVESTESAPVDVSAFIAPTPEASAPRPMTTMNSQQSSYAPQPYYSQNQQNQQGGGYYQQNREYSQGGGRGVYQQRGGYGGGQGQGGGYRQSQQQQQRFAPRYQPRQGNPMTGENATMAAPFAPDINVPTETMTGILDIMPDGHGFVRPKFTPSDKDIYISQSQIRRFMIRNGDAVTGQARQPKENERYWGLLKVEKINGEEAETMATRPKFEDLTPVYPSVMLKLETEKTTLSTRIIDLMAPIGFGQRGLIVSPPKAGKTTILKELAAGITSNYPNVHLMAALIGERPEEVTDLSRCIKGEVLASNFDQSPQEQTRVAEVALERAKRLVEMGKDVVVLLDSVTRLARAYNLVVNPSGRTLSGGFDPAALYLSLIHI